MKFSKKIVLGLIALLLSLTSLTGFAADSANQQNQSGSAANLAQDKNSQENNAKTAELERQQTVLAIVNGRKITQGELDSVSIFPLDSIADPQLRAQARNKILQDLIDEYIVEQEIANGPLSKNPIFSQLLEREKRSASLNLYKLFKATTTPPKILPSDIDAFIRTHENYFSKRKTWHFYQFIIPPQSTSKISIDEFRQASKQFSEKQFSAWLIDKGIDFERTNVWQGSEQMPQDVLDNLSKLSPNSTYVDILRGPSGKASSSANPLSNGLRVIYFIDSYPDPIDVEQARNSVARNLIAQANKLKIAALMDELRAKSKIEVMQSSALDHLVLQNLASQERVTMRKSMRQMEYVRTAWFFCFLCLVLIALWNFYKNVPELHPKRGGLRNFQKLEQLSYFRMLETLFAGLLLAFPLFRFVADRLLTYDLKVIAIAAVVGISIAGAVVIAIKKISVLRELNQIRFLTLIALFVVQYLAMVI